MARSSREVSFVASPAGGSESIHLMYLMAIAAAEQSIDLQAAYFVPEELISKALVTARLRGVRIRILVPGKHSAPRCEFVHERSPRARMRSPWLCRGFRAPASPSPIIPGAFSRPHHPRFAA